MTTEELYELEEKYRKFCPLESAVQIIKLIDYARRMKEFEVTVNKWANDLLEEIK
jgi:hypothetical protein